jgi:hypothetical protein
VTVISRLWGRFELLPFRRGVTLIAVLVIVPVLIVGGLFAVRGGGERDLPRHQAAAASPSAREPESEAVEGVERASGDIVASHSVRSGPKPSSAASASPRASHSASPRPRRSVTTSPAATPSTRCPTGLKKWSWMWDLCKRRRGGHRDR